MSFLPGLTNAVGKAYTALDDIVGAAEKGHAVVDLLAELSAVIRSIHDLFAHQADHPSATPPPISISSQKALLVDGLGQSQTVPLPSALVAPSLGTTREEKITRDLQLE